MKQWSRLLAAINNASARHGGVLPLLKRLLQILVKEGPGGFAARKTLHLRRLSSAQSSSAGSPSGESGAMSNTVHPDTRLFSALEPGLSLIGHPYVVLGRAEDIRTAACACASASVPFSMINLYGDYGREEADKHKEFPFFDKVAETAKRRGNLLYLNADEMNPAVDRLGHMLFSGAYNIGCFAWELSRFPQSWVGSFESLHEIWAPTRFIQQAIADSTRLPVILMPFAIEPGPAAGSARHEWGIAEEKFVFLFVFDFRAYIQRKNPLAILEAFFRAFPKEDSSPVQLIIKVNGAKDRPDEYQALRSSAYMNDSRINVIDTVLDDKGIKTLVQLCDSFVSLHRSEGFGRGLAEAMYYGKPVIATGYSGNVDFMHPGNACLVDYALVPVNAGDYPHGEGQLWAEPDVDHAAWYMRKLVEDSPYAHAIGESAAVYIKQFHSYNAIGELHRKRLKKLGILQEGA